MYRHTTLPRVLTGALVAVALVATTAQARPVDDTHAALAPVQNAQDLRSPDARDAARPHEVATTQLAPATATVPTWPTDPRPIAVEPVATDSGSGGVDWAPIGLAVAASLLAIGGIVALTRRSHRAARVHAGL